MKQRLKSAIPVLAVLLFCLALSFAAQYLPRSEAPPDPPSIVGAYFAGGISLLSAFGVTVSLLLGKYPLDFINATDHAKARQAAIAGILSMAAIGALLLWMAFSDPCSCSTHRYDPDAAIAVALIYAATGIYAWPRYDAAMQRISGQCTYVALAMLMPLLMIWTGFARAGQDVDFEPAGILALAVGASFAGSFWMGVKRGRADKARAKQDSAP